MFGRGFCGKISVGKWGRPFLFRGVFGRFWELGVSDVMYEVISLCRLDF